MWSAVMRLSKAYEMRRQANVPSYSFRCESGSFHRKTAISGRLYEDPYNRKPAANHPAKIRLACSSNECLAIPCAISGSKVVSKLNRDKRLQFLSRHTMSENRSKTIVALYKRKRPCREDNCTTLVGVVLRTCNEGCATATYRRPCTGRLRRRHVLQTSATVCHPHPTNLFQDEMMHPAR